MGYLHEGHLSLIRIAKERSDVVILTIFVNPTQFAPNEDLAQYPRDFDRDKSLAENSGVDILFAPPTAEMYADGFVTYVSVEKLTSVLEGKARPTHFRGVTTIVAKLFNCSRPHIAVFGQKDAQQAAVIKQMAKDLDFDIDIVVGPIIREADGLAMSSRNVYLSLDERRESPVLHASLTMAEEMIRGGERSAGRIISAMTNLIAEKPHARIDYISVADLHHLEEQSVLSTGEEVLISLAVRFGRTRLIDNTIITVP